MTRLLLFFGLALLLGSTAARRFLSPVPLGASLQGFVLLFVGAGLSVFLPLRELGVLAPSEVLVYLITVEAGQAVLILLLAATLFLVAELQRLPSLVLMGLGGWVLWGLAGIGHGGIHGDTVRGLHAIHAGAMSVWLGGLGALLSLPTQERRAAAQKFSPVAAGCVGLLALTGLGMGLEHVPTLDALRNSKYGQTLLLKLLVFCGVLGAAFMVRQSMPRRTLGWLLWLETGLLLLVLLLTERLGGLPLVH